MKYRIGPPAELLKEIGQVMVNYSECERSIHDIFRAVMSLDESQMYLLVAKANLNTEKMIPVIKAELHRIRPANLHESVLQGLADFTKSIPKRNAVAHWQWAVTEGREGFATNSLKVKPGFAPEDRQYTLNDLQRIAWEIARSAILLGNASMAMGFVSRRSLGGLNWSGDRYNFDSDFQAMGIQYALDRAQSFISDYESEHFPPEYSPSSRTS
ncbi:hypothetical protein [Pseudomonas syringae]|uniref:hypothetical protein n=1 Tax=Pseudomonas syringae TaxID=317 RepID=UPI000EFE85C3|nr:hypothetical protein [Pseudomonas syringae]